MYVEKSNTDNVLRDETVCHTDSENAIPSGNAFDFAQLHYKQQGDELLQAINNDLKLQIGKEFHFHGNTKSIFQSAIPIIQKTSKNYSQRNQNNHTNHSSDSMFSFYKAPINNTKPHSKTTLRKVFNAIVGNYYNERTEKLRAIYDVTTARKFKAQNFDYCTFSGIFSSRNEKSIIKHSGLLCVDFDHLQEVDLLRNQLLNDEYFDTQLLFVSPSGNGLKWIIKIDISEVSHAQYFNAVANYIKTTYRVEIDKSGKDTSRACFLSHDPNAFINPQLK